METRRVEKEKFEAEGRTDHDRIIRMPSESKGGVMETYFVVRTLFKVFIFNVCEICDDCGEELCYGLCNKFHYEEFKV